MFELFKKIMPKEEGFFDMFERHAACAVAASEMLQKILAGGKDTASHCKRLMQQEEDADAIAAEVVQALRRSFITPFDRSDIKSLISTMDDAVDQMNKTAKAVLLFEVTAFEPGMKTMGGEIRHLAGLVQKAVPLLRNVGQNGQAIHILTGEISQLEEDSDKVHDEGLKGLLKGKAKKDAMAFIIGSEIYSHLEKVADRFEDVAGVISGIAIEHA